jgi:hypothetical protein
MICVVVSIVVVLMILANEIKYGLESYSSRWLLFVETTPLVLRKSIPENLLNSCDRIF